MRSRIWRPPSRSWVTTSCLLPSDRERGEKEGQDLRSHLPYPSPGRTINRKLRREKKENSKISAWVKLFWERNSKKPFANLISKTQQLTWKYSLKWHTVCHLLCQRNQKTPTILSSVKIMRDALMYHWRLGSCGAGSPVKPRYTLWPKHWSSVQAAFEFFQDLKGFPDLQWHIIKYSNTYILVKIYQSIHCRNFSMMNKYGIQKHMRKRVHIYTTGLKIETINIFVHFFTKTTFMW